ncbi:DUF1365 domain-containing protein [Rhodobacter xanthinilyticus]|uniref:DUF1365 domain-containing protein n=1 Tax=Rhodobacter xanthinilyticus TaxID=1850250 RepID=UPI0009F5D47D|nr:DUF1365 domain-containing protein [Rhodobacter xanthinilyticus]
MTLAERLAGGAVLWLPACVTHARRGPLRHGFRTTADHLLFAPEALRPPRLMGHNRFNLFAFHDSDHGGPRGAGRGAGWAWEQFAAAGYAPAPGRVLALLTQPRFLGFWFAPVSFWMLLEGDALCAVIAEVNNTFGQRHSYLLLPPSPGPITAATALHARKVFHVSPFQDIAGGYRFNFALSPERVAIRIAQETEGGGIDTALAGPLRPLTARAILGAALRRPGGALRVLAQIYGHALALKLKGARYRPLPAPPDQEISR